MTREEVRALIKDFKRDWIPSSDGLHGEHICRDKIINVRSAQGLERCCHIVGNDYQSGPIYCGDLADFIADVKDMKGVIVAVCAYHKRKSWD